MSQKSVVLYLHVHQPYRVRPYTVFETAQSHDYFNASNSDVAVDNEQIFHKVADKSYRPMNAKLLELLHTHSDFKVSLSITGTFIDQAQQWAPDVLEDFKQLVATGRVEILAETYYHSLAFYYSKTEFEAQVQLHTQKIQEIFNVTPIVFRGTELAYDNSVAHWAQAAGYKGILAEGWDGILDWRSPGYVYQPPGTDSIGLLLKNYHLSDDIAFRFSNRAWSEWPLTADKFTHWLHETDSDAPLVNLFMDYETFGEHQWSDTGIFDFFGDFVSAWCDVTDKPFLTVSDAFNENQPVGELDVPDTVTWADSERDLSAWTGNDMQKEALKYLYALEHDIVRTNDRQLIADWRNLQASDHVYYMSTKWLADGDVHAYFSPYDSPYDAFLYYINVIRDLRWRLMKHHNTGRLHG
ncbi:alpha-amylase [bacterium]|nr:MAG: alpha-amylase [bacterium]